MHSSFGVAFFYIYYYCGGSQAMESEYNEGVVRATKVGYLQREVKIKLNLMYTDPAWEMR